MKINYRSYSIHVTPLTAKSSLFAISSMKPLTPRLLPVADAGVVGMLYSACKQSGVICVSQMAGTAARLERVRLDLRGRLTISNAGV